MTNDTDVDLELNRAAKYFAAGNFKRARVHYSAVLSRDPGDVRALAPMARIDAELGRTTFEESLTKVEYLVASHLDDDRLPGVLIGILARMGRYDECDEERRKFLDRFPNSPRAIQVWANGLQIDPVANKNKPEAQAEAWEFYKKALALGPLLTPCFKSAAYYAAQRADPANKSEALKGSGVLERMAIRTRGLGPQFLFAAILVAFVVAAFTAERYLAFSVVVQLLALGWGLWCIYSNNLMCCKKCRNAWIGLVVYLSLIAGVVDHPKTWYVEVALAVVMVIGLSLTGHASLVWPSAMSGDKENA